MAIHDKNELIYLSYDSVVEYEKSDYIVVSRRHFSNPIFSYLLYGMKGRGCVKYLWYDKRNHKIAILSECGAADEPDMAFFKRTFGDNFQVQIEKKEGAPEIFPTFVEVFESCEGSEMMLRDKRAGGVTMYKGEFVQPQHLTVYPYGE